MSLLKNADTVTFRKTEQSQIKTLVQRLEITNKNTDSCKYQWIDKWINKFPSLSLGFAEEFLLWGI